MFLLQILDKTDRPTVEAIVAAHVRPARVEAEVVRDVAIVLSGRPKVAVVLHAVTIRAIAAACGRKEDST